MCLCYTFKICIYFFVYNSVLMKIMYNLIDMYLGKTSLMYAAEGGHIEAVRLLINHGSDIKAKTLIG